MAPPPPQHLQVGIIGRSRSGLSSCPQFPSVCSFVPSVSPSPWRTGGSCAPVDSWVQHLSAARRSPASDCGREETTHKFQFFKVCGQTDRWRHQVQKNLNISDYLFLLLVNRSENECMKCFKQRRKDHFLNNVRCFYDVRRARRRCSASSGREEGWKSRGTPQNAAAARGASR